MKKLQLLTLFIVITMVGVLIGLNLHDETLFDPETPVPALWSIPTPGPRPTLLPFEPANVLEEQVTQIYEQVSGGVANITNRSVAYDFFMQPVPQEGSGSGFVYDADGHIVTNFHVIEYAQELLVTLADGRTLPAEVVGTDASNDLAVIHIEADNLPPPIPLAGDVPLRVGEFVIAIGNPFGLEGTMTLGIISSLGRVIQSPDGRFIGEAIQTDAAINPGNSGGPLLDLTGRIIGVNSQIISASGTSSGVGFAVPVSTLRRVIPQLIVQGHYDHPWLGVQTIDLTAERAQLFRDAGASVPVDQGVLVVEVVAGGPAAKAGIHGGTHAVRLGNSQIALDGDIITAVNGTPVTKLQELTVYLEDQTQVGGTVALTILREGQTQTVEVQLEARPQQP
jgi:S1-C subfamily serine protease